MFKENYTCDSVTDLGAKSSKEECLQEAYSLNRNAVVDTPNW